MKAGTVVRLPDNRIGTVVYNGLDGVGIKWGEHQVTPEVYKMLVNGAGGLLRGARTQEEREWVPDAMLRDPYPSADLPCVGEDFEVIGQTTEAR